MVLHDSMTRVYLESPGVLTARESTPNPELALRLVESTSQIVLAVVVIVIAVMVALAVRRGRNFFYRMKDEQHMFERERMSEIHSLLEISRRQQAEFAKLLEFMSIQNTTNLAATEGSEGIWRDQSEQALYAMYDSLSPTEIAIAVFTSPASFPSMDRGPIGSRFVTATAKETYLWAGAVAYVMENRPETSDRQILEALNRSLRRTVQQNLSSFSGWSVSPLPFEAQARLIEDFVLEAGLDVSFREIEARTNAAYEMLLWRGLIEDPLWKGVSGVALAVALIVPVQWSSTQSGFSVNALGWRYTQLGEGNNTERSFKLRVKEVSKAVIDEMVPGVLKIVGELSESPNRVQEDSARGTGQPFGKANPTQQMQEALRRAGFDPGPVDGFFGPLTRGALMEFQRAWGLPATGKPDAQSIQMLQLKKPDLSTRGSGF
ncbi:peptidoglycan-binding domain-containing protein [Paraburkholderia flagellata]|uniref:peptidoglycan-binding domain-containing protein n=1 Tax=Paraburkholderia flagellata TaxID=2883241 RepID=UPI001F404606|nr:peptidoglycan-binding protein [Paraburkholderia flagellata]